MVHDLLLQGGPFHVGNNHSANLPHLAVEHSHHDSLSGRTIVEVGIVGSQARILALRDLCILRGLGPTKVSSVSMGPEPNFSNVPFFIARRKR